MTWQSDEQEREVAEQTSARRRGAPFDLSAGPLIRGRLLQAGGGRARAAGDDASHRLGWLVDGGVDPGSGWRCTRRTARDGRNPLAPLPIQYADYAQWQRQWLQGEVLEEQLSTGASSWRERRALLELPTDRPRPASQSYRGASVRVGAWPELSRADCSSLARRHGATLFMTLLRAWRCCCGG